MAALIDQDMRQMTVSLREEQAEWIEENIGDGEQFNSKSDAVRTIMDRHEELQKEIERLRAEREELRSQLAATNQRIDEANEIIEFVDEQRELERSRAKREERRAQAGVLTRAKWWLVGMD